MWGYCWAVIDLAYADGLQCSCQIRWPKVALIAGRSIAPSFKGSPTASDYKGLGLRRNTPVVHDSNRLATAKDPRWQRPYTELTYQPMLEVMSYLCANGYKTFIVTGFGQDFVREYSQRIYDIPPEGVIGSALAVRYLRQGW
jgi:hypothetical protein